MKIRSIKHVGEGFLLADVHGGSRRLSCNDSQTRSQGQQKCTQYHTHT